MSAPLHTARHRPHAAGCRAADVAPRCAPRAGDARAVGWSDVVSERDLFALQRLSLRQLSSRIRAAHDLASLQRAAVDIRRFARNLLGQGVHARQLTELISHLNDVLTERRWCSCSRASRASTCSAPAGWPSVPRVAASRRWPPTRTTGSSSPASDPESDRPRWLRFRARRQRGARRLRLPAVQGQRDGQQPGVLSDRWTSGARASRTGSSTVRPRIC